jgi:hypothetical protein
MPSVTACSDAIGFDCNTKLTLASARAAAAMGFRFVARYVGLSQPNAGDLDPDETQIVLGEIGALWVVQHCLNPGWSPSGQLGQAHGTAAARNALAAGYELGAVVWQDLEGVAPGTPAQSVIDYCDQWGDAIIHAGFLHGLYSGFGSMLSAEQLYALPTVHTYWAASPSYYLPTRGFAMIQIVEDITPRNLGFQIDIDMCGADALGGRPLWMAA